MIVVDNLLAGVNLVIGLGITITYEVVAFGVNKKSCPDATRRFNCAVALKNTLITTDEGVRVVFDGKQSTVEWVGINNMQPKQKNNINDYICNSRTFNSLRYSKKN